MLEQVRQYYLQQLGVNQWYARKPLAHAAPGMAFDVRIFTVCESARVTCDPRPTARGLVQGLLQASQKPQPEPVRRQVASTIAPITNVVARADNAAAKAETPAVHALKGDVDALSQVNVGIWQANHWLFLADWSSDASSDVQTRLADSILSALGALPEAFSRKKLRWPLFENPQIHQLLGVSLADIILQLLGNGAWTHLVALGPAASAVAQWLDGAYPRQSPVQFRHACTDNLLALTHDAAAKRRLWHALRPASHSGV